MLGAVHAVQLVHPQEVGRQPLAPFFLKPTVDDSSDEEDSSGDESIDQPHRPPRVPRHFRSAEEHQARRQNYNNRYRTWYYRNAALEARNDYLLLEYIEGGDLRMLINRISEATPGPGGPGGVTPIPNRILVCTIEIPPFFFLFLACLLRLLLEVITNSRCYSGHYGFAVS